MISDVTIGMYNAAARSYNNLKITNLLNTERSKDAQESVDRTLVGLRNDIFSFLESSGLLELWKSQGFPSPQPASVHLATGDIMLFYYIKDGKFIHDPIFSDSRRFSCGTWKKGESHRYEGPWAWCGPCAEKIYRGILVYSGEDRIVSTELSLDVEDYSDYEDPEFFMLHCFGCRSKLITKTET